MKKVLAMLGSGRADGYTSRLLKSAVDGASTVDGVEVEWIHLHRYTIRPCTSCFHCIRNPGAGCVIEDDFGRRTKGVLYKKVRESTGFIIGDAVHNWTITAAMRLFIERLYPFLWTGELAGSHLASISCASNSGMHRESTRLLCQESFCFGFHYAGGLPVHVAGFDEALEKAYSLGRKLAEASQGGRTPVQKETLIEEYEGEMWHILPQYLDNLTEGTMEYTKSLPVRALREQRFHNPEAIALLREAAGGLQQLLELHEQEDTTPAAGLLVRVAACWVQATWKEFVQPITRSDAPHAYRE